MSRDDEFEAERLAAEPERLANRLALAERRVAALTAALDRIVRQSGVVTARTLAGYARDALAGVTAEPVSVAPAAGGGGGG